MQTESNITVQKHTKDSKISLVGIRSYEMLIFRKILRT